MESLSQRPVYDLDRMKRYFTYVNLSDIQQNALISMVARHQDIKTQHRLEHPVNSIIMFGLLKSLQQHHLATVPFENLSLHYSSHHTINLDADYLYDKIVKRSHGGYCMENNCLFGTVLRSLGYTVYSAGARVHEGEGVYTGWSHMVNIVTLTNGQRYLVDVGFGSHGSTEPLYLVEDHVQDGISPSSMRLVQQKLPAATNPHDRLWVYQHRLTPDSDWEAMYCFTEMEFLPRDYEVMSFWTSQSRKTWFTYSIIVVKFIMKRHELVGKYVLNGAEVKEQIGAHREHLKTLKTEEERVKCLADVFGIALTGEEKEGIRRMVTELPRTVAGNNFFD